jgi:hypothetical protein
MLPHFCWIPCLPAHDVPVPGAQPARHGGTASEDGDHGSQGLPQDSQDAGNSQYLGGNNRAAEHLHLQPLPGPVLVYTCEQFTTFIDYLDIFTHIYMYICMYICIYIYMQIIFTINHRKPSSWSFLPRQVTRHLTSRFQPAPTLIKQRIEKLIEREHLGHVQ